MPREWRVRYAGARYHVTARGDGRRAIFAKDEDAARFLEQLDCALAADQVRLLAYCLMPNHYHLFVETPLGNLPRFMQRLNTAYGLYLRYKRRWPGHCFQGRYGAKLVGGEGYALRLTRYIHLNPVWTQAVQSKPVTTRIAFLNTFMWSSYRGYAGLTNPEERIDYRLLEETGHATNRGRRSAYRKYAESMVGTADEVMESAKGRSAYALGDERFVEETEGEAHEARLRRGVTGDVAWPVKEPPALPAVINAVCEHLKLAPADLRRDARLLGDQKGLALEAICQLANCSQRAAAQALGIASELTVGQHRRRLVGRLGQDAGLQRTLRQLLSLM